MTRWTRIVLGGGGGALVALSVAAVLQLRDRVTAECQVLTAGLDRCDPATSPGGQCSATLCRFEGRGRRCATVYLRRQDGRHMHSAPICYDGRNDRSRTVTEYEAFPVSPLSFCRDPLLPFGHACTIDVKLERWP